VLEARTAAEIVTINELVTKVEVIAGVKLRRKYDLTAPLGVAGRNSDNTFIKQVLNWEADTSLTREGTIHAARTQVPAIIFIDEIDAITERRSDGDSAADRAQHAVVNMFLAEMDGLDSSTRVFVIGATNRPELVDEAFLRPGPRRTSRRPTASSHRMTLDLGRSALTR
jgi:ATPase family associated with various cellular activities (AAA)